MFALEELQKMNKNDLIKIIGNYISDQEIWLNKVAGLEKEINEQKAEIERRKEEKKTLVWLNQDLEKQVDKWKEQSGKHVIESDYWKNTHNVLAGSYNKLKDENAELQKQVDELKERVNLYETNATNMEFVNYYTKQAVKDMAKEILNKAIIIDKNTGNKGFICIEALTELCKSKGVEVE